MKIYYSFSFFLLFLPLERHIKRWDGMDVAPGLALRGGYNMFSLSTYFNGCMHVYMCTLKTPLSPLEQKSLAESHITSYFRSKFRIGNG